MKAKKCLINFDIRKLSFNKKEHLTKAIKLAEIYTNINKQEQTILCILAKPMYPMKTELRTKKSKIDDFDTAMGLFKGAEVSYLIDCEIFSMTASSNIGLYRDDSLAIIKQSSETTLKKIKIPLIKK